jgi:hypothetical protein
VVSLTVKPGPDRSLMYTTKGIPVDHFRSGSQQMYLANVIGIPHKVLTVGRLLTGVWLLALLLTMCSSNIATADVDTRGSLREISSPLYSPGEVKPLVSSENEDYECTAKYSDVQSGAFTWVIGNCPKGSTLEAVVRRAHTEAEPENYSLGGWVGESFEGCGWIEDEKFKPKAKKVKPTTACTEIASGKYEVAESNFMSKHNGGAGDGYYVVNKTACPEYANYRPWSSSNLEKEKLRTEPAYARQEPGSSYPALKWRYTTKYNSTDATGQYVMVRDVTIAAGEGNWVFVPRSCLPATLPENESERVPSPPSATTNAASGVQTPSATLNGTVNPNGLDAKYHFEYGTSPSFGTSTAEGDAGSGTAGVAESSTVTSLAAGTTYYYRIVAASASGTTDGSTQSFTTQPPPAVTTNPASEVKVAQVTFDSTVNPEGLATRSFFEYGSEAGHYTSATTQIEAGSGTSGVAQNATISSLQPNTTIHYRIVAYSSAGASYGADETVTTTILSKPSALLAPNGNQYVFYRGNNGQLYFWYWNASAAKWGLNWLGSTGAMAGNPSAVIAPNNNMYVYYRGTNGGMDFWYWNASKAEWSLNWLGSAGAMAGNPTAVVAPNSNMYVYYRGTNGLLNFWYWNASKAEWSLNWLESTRTMVGEPSAILAPNSNMYVFYRGASGTTNFWYWNAAKSEWSINWFENTHPMAGDPSAVIAPNNNMYVYYRGTNGGMDFWYWNASKAEWSINWFENAHPMAGEPSALMEPSGAQYVYYRGVNGQLYFWLWNTSTAEWSLNWLGATNAMGGEPTPLLLPEGSQFVYYGGSNEVLDFWLWNTATAEWGLNWFTEM